MCGWKGVPLGPDSCPVCADMLVIAINCVFAIKDLITFLWLAV